MPIPSSGKVVDINPQSLALAHDAAIISFTDEAGRAWIAGAGTPRFKTNVKNGKAAIDFAPTARLETSAALDLSGTEKVTMFAILRDRSANVTVAIEHSPDSNANKGLFVYTTGDGRLDVGASDAGTYSFQTTAESFRGFKLLGVAVDRSLSVNCATARVDGQATTGSYNINQDLSGNFGSYKFNIGARANSAFGGDFELLRLVIYDRVLSTAERQQVEDEFDKLYALDYYSAPLTNFEDNFNRADSADLGENYAAVTGANLVAPNFSISQNRAFLNSPNGDSAVKISYIAENSYSRLKIAEISGAGGSVMAARIKADGSFYFGAVWNTAAYTQIGRCNSNGTFTNLGFFPTVAAQVGDEVYFHVTGQLLELFLKRGGTTTKIGEYTDNSAEKITGAGKNGLFGDYSANKIDDYRVSATPFLDSVPPSDVTNLTVSSTRVVDSSAATDNVGVAGYLTQYSDDGGTNWINHPTSAKQFTDTVVLLPTVGNNTRLFRRKAIDQDSNLSANWSNIARYDYTILPPPIIVDKSPLPYAQIGKNYQRQFKVRGGSGSGLFSLQVQGNLPNNSLNNAGLLNIPVVGGNDYSFILLFTDADGRTVSKAFSIPVSEYAYIQLEYKRPLKRNPIVTATEFPVIEGLPDIAEDAPLKYEYDVTLMASGQQKVKDLEKFFEDHRLRQPFLWYDADWDELRLVYAVSPFPSERMLAYGGVQVTLKDV